jgi:molybdenum cofactor guanylyltransferase
MGGNKPFHAFGNSTLIETVIGRLSPQVDTIAVNVGRPTHPLVPALSKLGLPLIFDDEDLADLGPLSGVLSALSFGAVRGEAHIFTAPCDMPCLPSDLILRLQDTPPCDVAFIAGKRHHPLCARWAVSVEPLLRDNLIAARTSTGLAVMKFIDPLQIARVRVTDDEAFVNLNASGDAG